MLLNLLHFSDDLALTERQEVRVLQHFLVHHARLILVRRLAEKLPAKTGKQVTILIFYLAMQIGPQVNRFTVVSDLKK